MKLYECKIITTFDVLDNMYIALLPIENNPESDYYDIYLYRLNGKNAEGDPILEDIEDEAEFLLVKDRLSEVLDVKSFYELAESIIKTDEKGDQEDASSI